jgi:hypothetical protein
MVTRNNVAAGTATACALVNNSNTVVQNNCSEPTNNTTSGVRVTLSRTRDNFFLGVLGRPTVNVTATATARVVTHDSFDAGNAPFIVCGLNTELEDGGTLSILVADASSPIGWRVNDAAVGETFDVHGPNVATCGAGNNAFKGLNDQDASEGITDLPATLFHDTGVHAGPTRTRIQGINGCGAVQDDNCVMILPVATSITGPPQHRADAVMYLPFLIEETGANSHSATLISKSYLTTLPTTGTSSWTIGSTGLVSARMVQ